MSRQNHLAPLEVEPDEILTKGRKELLANASKVGVDLTDLNSKCEIYGDDPSQMTNSRLFARFLSRFRCYYPRKENGPSLDEAWSHYEHFTLARYYTDEKEPFVRAEVGERKRPTLLYPVWSTPVKELGDFGISVRMYFSTLLALAAFLAIAGALNLPLFWYFWNYAEEEMKDGIDNAVRGSAICDEGEWVECESCNGEYQSDFPDYRLDGQNVLRNTCNFEDWLVPGLFSYAASIALIIMFGVAFFRLQRKAEVTFDEEVQTASDYSIKVVNPPPDATDPEEWRNFFMRYADKGVSGVTVALNNAKLIKTLVKRRKMLKSLARSLPYGTDMTDDETLAQVVAENTTHSIWSMTCCSSVEKKYAKVKQIEEEIKDLLQQKYRAVSVFVTFETERGQRNALHVLSTGKLNIWRNVLDKSKFEGAGMRVEEAVESSTIDLRTALQQEKTESRRIRLVDSTESSSGIENAVLFRGTKVLNAKEAAEPNDIRWKDLEVQSSIRFVQYVGTTIALIVFVVWSGFFIFGLESNFPGTFYTPLFITVTNILVPKICDFINAFESHSTEGSRQSSLYIKIALFRWFNSAICLSIIMGFIESISIQDGEEERKESLTYSVYPIIFAEMLTIPLIKLLDIMGNIRKHILAPRAKDQDSMNACFIGGRFELAERYTDATKVLFVALFYSAILPESFFLGAAALLIHFAVGKFCLLRLWRPTADIGPVLARLSRNYFFSVALITHVIMSAYWWSGYPYDKVCLNEETGEYDYCDQDMFRAAIFPPLPRFQPPGEEWMTSSQATLTSLYGWTSVVVVVFAAFVLLKEYIYPLIEQVFYSVYEPDGADQGIDFSEITHLHEVMGYVPQIREGGFSHPLVVCNLQGIDDDLVGWKDQFRGFDPHNLYLDVRSIIKGDPVNLAFSVMKTWPAKYTNPERSSS